MNGAVWRPLGVSLLCVLAGGPPVSSQSPPLPEAAPFFAAARTNLERSRREARGFAYTERRTQLHMNPFGRMGSGGTLTFRVTPLAGGSSIERRLIERDGTPVSDGDVTTRDTRRPAGRADRPSPYEDALAALEFTVARREQVEGRSMIVVRFTPRPRASPGTREGRMAKSFEGEAWVDERAEEVVRVDATAVENLSYGFGLVARLSKGAQATAVRSEVLPGVWQPTSLRIVGDGRALLFRRLRIDHALEWFDYRRVAGDVSAR